MWSDVITLTCKKKLLLILNNNEKHKNVVKLNQTRIQMVLKAKSVEIDLEWFLWNVLSWEEK